MSEKAIDGDRVRELRKARGWTQQDLARESGVSQSALSRIERGDSHGSYATTARSLALAMAAPASTLRGFTGDAIALAALSGVPAWAAGMRLVMSGREAA